jgi:hypothetical protein
MESNKHYRFEFGVAMVAYAAVLIAAILLIKNHVTV